MTPSPCKVAYNGALRRFLINRPAVWQEFEDKIRTVYSLSPKVALDVHYRDDEGDVITLNTDSELDDVLAMHALFGHLSPVKFEVFVREGNAEDLPSMTSSAIQSIVDGSSAASSTITTTGSQHTAQLTPWSLDQLQGQSNASSTSAEFSPSSSQPSLSIPVYSSDNSDDVSLIDLNDGAEIQQKLRMTPASDSEEPISYPQQDLVEAALLQEAQQRLEALEIDAPVFTSSILGTRQESAVQYPILTEYESGEEEAFSTRVSQELDASHPVSVAAAVEHYETLSSRQHQTPVSNATPLIDFGGVPSSTTDEVVQGVAKDATQKDNKDKQEDGQDDYCADPSRVASERRYHSVETSNADLNIADPVEHELPSTTSFAATSTSTSTSEQSYQDGDKALMEQFQLLIKEFQHIIQNNPQLVALAGSIMSKILNNVKVNVESFANFLQAQAQQAAQNAQQGAQQGAQQAAQQAQQLAQKQAQQATQQAAWQAAQSAQEVAAQAATQTSTQVQEATSKAQEAAEKAHTRVTEAAQQLPLHPHLQGHSLSSRFVKHCSRGSSPPLKKGSEEKSRVPFGSSSSSGLTAPLPPMPPMPSMPSMPSMSSQSTMRTMPPMMQVPSRAPLSPLMSILTSLGRNDTSQSSGPSPFTNGFPFITNDHIVPQWDRSVTNNTETSKADSVHPKVDKGKGVASSTENCASSYLGPEQNPSNAATSAMPGSFPTVPQVSENKTWVWSRLPDEGNDHHQPPSTRAKFGWVWKDKEERKSFRVEEAPLHSLSDQSATETIANNVQRGQKSHLGLTIAEIPLYSFMDVQQGQNFHGFGMDHKQEPHGVAKPAIDEQQHRRAYERHHSEREHERRQNGGQHLLQRARPAGHQSSMSRSQTRHFGAGSLADIWPSVSSGPGQVLTTPGNFPARSTRVEAESMIASPSSTLALAGAPVTATTAVTNVHVNPFADPIEFEQEIRTLVAMGFKDDAELRTVVHDFGGEIEAIVEFLIAK
ncbi:hypothetical protein BGZ94_007748 [Podila epigama]|nr:hypothetical protein BGZ94_007748 [Podila epigama]